MKNYILVEDVYPLYLAKDKKSLIDWIKQYTQDMWLKHEEELRDLHVRTIEFNAKKVYIDHAMDGDIYAIDKKTDEIIEYNDYEKNWIKDKEIKKDFLYYNLL